MLLGTSDSLAFRGNLNFYSVSKLWPSIGWVTSFFLQENLLSGMQVVTKLPNLSSFVRKTYRYLIVGMDGGYS